MTEREKKDIILSFLGKNKLAVLSTIDNNKPESAVIFFSETKNLEIIFDTFNTYRKYKNLEDNQHVSLVIGWDDEITVQYEGVARELQGREIEEGVRVHLDKLPRMAKWYEMEQTRYFQVRPKWIRYANLGSNPHEIFEVEFWK